jgi:hypothetical protein
VKDTPARKGERMNLAIFNDCEFKVPVEGRNFDILPPALDWLTD